MVAYEYQSMKKESRGFFAVQGAFEGGQEGASKVEFLCDARGRSIDQT